MATLAVDPEALSGAGAAVVSAGEGLGSVVLTLTTALAGCSGMAGDDPAGAAFGRSYNSSTSKLLEAMVVTRNGLCRLGDGVRTSAYNYSVAEAMSNIAGHGDVLTVPPSTGSLSAGSAPSAVGNGGNAPAGWGWVVKYIGMIWPTGDSERLRTAAAAWSAAGTEFLVNEKFGVAGPLGTIRAQQIPESEAIVQALADADHGCTAINHQCAAVAAQLSTYAAKVDEVHAAILDLLARICDPLTGIKEVWDILTDKDEDEIKKIANDIRMVVNNFTAEVDALRHQTTALLSEATTVVTTMGGYAAKEWDQFLHGTEVGRAVNQVGQFGKGLGEEAGGLVKEGWTYSAVRAAIDPDGWYQSWKQMVDGMAPLVGLGGEHAPGVGEAWKDLGKEVTHWDEWKTNPAEAAGKSTFDVATLFAPGGVAGAAGKGGRAAADAAEAAAKAGRGEAAVSRALGDTAKSAPSAGASAPAPRAPRLETLPDKPAISAAPKPASAPTEGQLPLGPTESKAPVAEKPATAEPTVPAAKLPAESPHASASPPLAAHPPTGHPQPPEPMPAGAPAALAEHPAGLPTVPDHPSHVAPAEALSAPHTPSAPVPHSPAVDGHSLEPRPPLDGGSPGGHPPHSSPPHDGVSPHGPHSPGDGSAGEHDHGVHHDHLPEPYAPSDVAMDAAQRIYERAALAEREISPALVDAVGDAGGHLERFDSRLKEIDSLARKLDGELKYASPSDFGEIHAAENGINDAVRYTAVVPADGYWDHGGAVIKALEERGFTLKYDPGGWKVPDEYRGRNLTFQTPDGMQFEVQIHTGDSLSAAEHTHRMYEEQRLLPEASERKAELKALQAEIFNSVPIPYGTPLKWRDP